MMKHSHNDYWNRSLLFTAMNEGCNIFEVDVIYLNDDLYMSHSWRPCPGFTYGKLEKAFERISKYHHHEVYLYLEIKTSNIKAIILIDDLIQKYRGKVKILVKGIDRWFSPDREFIAKKINFINKHNDVQLFDNFIKENKIERVEVYKKSKWRFWNRW